MSSQPLPQQFTTENGNALWLILIAVVLLGSLTMILSRSGSTVDQSGDIEQQNVRTSQVLRYAKSIEAAIQEMRLRGVSENDFSFFNAATLVDYTNTNCDDAADRSFPDCLIFDSRGAGLRYVPPPAGVNDGSDWIFTAANGFEGVNSPASELAMILPNMNAAVCAQINRLLDVTFSGNELDVDFTAFTGAYPQIETVDLGNGQEAGCIDFDNAGSLEPFFYYILIQR